MVARTAARRRRVPLGLMVWTALCIQWLTTGMPAFCLRMGLSRGRVIGPWLWSGGSSPRGSVVRVRGSVEDAEQKVDSF